MAKVHPLSGVRKWLEREEWAQPFDELLGSHLEEPCKAAGIEMEELSDVIGDVLSSNAFSCVFEDMLASEFENGRNIVDDYLKRRGWKEPVPNKRYMMALRTSVMSLYEVSDIVRGRSFLARDVLRGGEPVRVSESLATLGMRPWDLVGLRLVKMGARTEMSGGALPMRREVGEMLREGFAGLREEMRDKIREWQKPEEPELDPYAFDTEVLRRVSSLFINTWLNDILQAELDPIVPELINSEGDLVEFMTVRYPLKPDADRKALSEAIAAIPGFRAAADDHWNWSGPPDTSAPDDELEDAKRFVTFLPDGSISLGDIELEADSLKLTTNSPQRAERGRALLESVIGELVGDPEVESKTVDEMLEARRAAGNPPRSSGLSVEEESVFVHETLDGHYRRLLDQPVPALGDLSPRESARTTEGRERLVGWLKALENANAQLESGSSIVRYDTRWLWEELGVSDLRR
jgi:hypothetical protein